MLLSQKRKNDERKKYRKSKFRYIKAQILETIIKERLENTVEFKSLSEEKKALKVKLELYHRLQNDASVNKDILKYLATFRMFDRNGSYLTRKKILTTISFEEKKVWFRYRRERVLASYTDGNIRISESFKNQIYKAMEVRLERLAENREFEYDTLRKRKSSRLQGAGRDTLEAV